MSPRLIVPGLLVTVALTGGCGGERSEARPSVDVTVTRGGGAAVEFPTSVRAWCGPFDKDNTDVEAVHVMAGKHDLRRRFWQLTAVRSDVEDNLVTTFPNSFVFTEPRGAALFAYDNVPRGNELSSAEEESSGRIRVELSGCEPGDTVRLTFDDVELAASSTTCRASPSTARSWRSSPTSSGRRGCRTRRWRNRVKKGSARVEPPPPSSAES